ncbi:LEAF RUST 10 DISEASE-RESISTANCE LOCUS RECEPTOR-LIKE PROTEIN KINASE-like 1.5 [Macadamia integrifolia]|uniref:LEAF RUST 10 DISEASE-RESISTANCE LOCUS RECEPTOR-LIKE PROTEIN KINASE-like 1.5 n=1 Tax=Macadamia integrifolia TaxID=60698 RepID=UPI001C4F6EA1|nr:LEAF RUST 10 DISEASE-RESISTANCE LOCUS RECEPTOR-LIKE PROTEIN KINASE-like 1.5 [Macadamia integrifolia]
MSPRSIICMVTVILLRVLSIDLTIAYACYSRLAGADTDRSSSSSSSSSFSCPPFTSPPSFPFATTPGCGHPSFQIHCSSPHSFISINNFSFALLRHELNSTFLLLSPQPSPILNAATQSSCPTPGAAAAGFFNSIIPNRSIDLSGSPFRFSDASCSRFFLLRPCESLSSRSCTKCPWECEVHNNPVRLLSGCGAKRHHVLEPGCQEDVLGYLRSLLKLGIQVEWDENDDPYFSSCQACQAVNGVCGFNSSDPRKPFLCFHSQTQFPASWIHRESQNRIVLFSTLVMVICLLVVVGVATLVFRFRALELQKSVVDPTTLFLHHHRSVNLLPPVFTYGELEASTNRFDPRNKIGDGGFGSVYIGHLSNGQVVAVKKLHRQQAMAAAASAKAFCNEILILSSIDHPNLVKLHGYCSDPRGLVLVYDYVPNGTLADHLHGSKCLERKRSLTWEVRVEAALQTAMALEYLHFSVAPAIVHRDITSSNIFVEKDMRIKVGDFGLSRLLVFTDSSSSKSVWTGPQGTPGYVDPEYHRSFRLTEKSDVYSFGVVLFELISGMKAVDLSRDKWEVSLADMVVLKIQVGSLHQVVDPFLLLEGDDAIPVGSIDAMAELAFRCVAADKDDRPDARELVAELKQIRNRTRGGH